MTAIKVLVLIGLGVGCFALFMSPNHGSNTRSVSVPAADPCWFVSTKGFDMVESSVIQERQNRATYGYPSDMDLASALEIFNQEQTCVYKGDDLFVALTEDELLSAIAVPPDYGLESVRSSQSDAIRFILINRRLPKGSLLINEGLGTYQSPIGKQVGDEVRVRGQRIYLLLGLDKHPRMDQPFRPEQVFLIKKTLYGLSGL